MLQDKCEAALIFGADDLIAQAEFTNQLERRRLGREKAVRAGFERASANVLRTNDAAKSRRLLYDSCTDAGLLQVVRGAEARNPTANDDNLYGRNSRTMSTTARTLSTGVSGRMPWPTFTM